MFFDTKFYTTNLMNGNIVADFECGKIKLPKLRNVKANYIGNM